MFINVLSTAPLLKHPLQQLLFEKCQKNRAQITRERVTQWHARYPPEISDKSVGERVIGGRMISARARATEIRHIYSTLEREVPIVAIFFSSGLRPHNPAGCHNCIRRLTGIGRIVLRSSRAARESLMEFRRACVCDSRTITVTVTVMGNDNGWRNIDGSIFAEFTTRTISFCYAPFTRPNAKWETED